MEKTDAGGYLKEANDSLTAMFPIPLSPRRDLNLSVCVPCMPSDIPTLPSLFRSIAKNTLLPGEVIIAVSQTNDEQAAALQAVLRRALPFVRVINSPKHRYAGWNRNHAAAASRGNILAFFDADDEMHPRRLEVLSEMMAELNPRCLVHAYTSVFDPALSYDWRTTRTLFGEAIHRGITTREKTDYVVVKKLGLLIRSSLNHFGAHHGNPTCQKAVLGEVPFPNERRGQDSMFLRQVLSHFGPKNDTMVFVDLPLTLYLPRDTRGKSWFAKMLLF